MSTTPPSLMRRFSSRKMSEFRTQYNHLDNTKSTLKQYGNPISSTRIVDSSTFVEVAHGSRKRKWKAFGIEDRLQKPKGPHSRISNLRRAPSGPPSNPLSAMALPALPQTPMKLRPHHLTTKRSEEIANSLPKVNNAIRDTVFRKEEISRRSGKIRLRNRVSLSDPARNLENQQILNEQTAAHVSRALHHPDYRFEASQTSNFEPLFTVPRTVILQPAEGYTWTSSEQPVAIENLKFLNRLDARLPNDWAHNSPASLIMETQQQTPQGRPYQKDQNSPPRGTSGAQEIEEMAEKNKEATETVSEIAATQKTGNTANQIFTHFTITQDRTNINTNKLLVAVQNRESSFEYSNK